LTPVAETLVGAGSALWLGLLTSISPCPLATNVAAISYLGRGVDQPGRVLCGGVLYIAGRAAAYVTLGLILVTGLMSMPEASRFLQLHMNRILGPVLIVAGVLLLEVLRPILPGLGRFGERLRQRLAGRGVWGAAPLGALFALSFCPVSAALFFGSLVPLALQLESPLLLPVLYGVGTALPVVVFALLIAFGTRFVAQAFGRVAVAERWIRRLTGVTFIGVGLYLTLINTLGFRI